MVAASLKKKKRRGWVNNPAGVRWGVALKIVWAWLFTIQSAAIVAAVLYFGLRALGI